MEEELPGPSRTYAGALAGDPLVAVARVRDGRRLLKQVEETFERVRLRPPRPIPFPMLPLSTPSLARARLPLTEDHTARSSVARFASLREVRSRSTADGMADIPTTVLLPPISSSSKPSRRSPSRACTRRGDAQLGAPW